MTTRTHSGHGFKYSGTSSHDAFVALAAGDGQVHAWGNNGDDLIYLDFAPQGVGDAETGIASLTSQWWVGGHHVYGGRGSGSAGADTFDFTNVHNVDGVTVGRVEDYDASRDKILIEGSEIDLTEGEGVAGARGQYDWRVVSWDTNPDDIATSPQPWLVIDTNGGVIFYALEGARVVEPGTGESNGANQERHFIHYENLPSGINGRASEQAILDLQATPYVDPVNYVPVGYVPQNGGKLINDYDDTLADAQNAILGSSSDDVIAAGVNNDTVEAAAGDDTVWGGSGDDWVNGGNGNDLIFGTVGNDTLLGDQGRDTLIGGTGNDLLHGGLDADRFVFEEGFGNDTIIGFDVNSSNEVIDLSDVAEITDFEDLVANHLSVQSMSRAVISDGLGNQITVNLMVNMLFNGGAGVQDLQADDFIF